MRITTCHSTGRTETGILRMLDGRRRVIVILAPWNQSLAETYAKVADQLTDEERREGAEAFRLDPGGGDAA